MSTPIPGLFGIGGVTPTQPPAPEQPPFVPKFIAPTIKSIFGGVWTWTNTDWFLDDDSTKFMATKYHAIGVEKRIIFGSGPYSIIDPPGLQQNWLVFASAKGDGIPIPAGMLASYYLRWDQTTAEKLIWKNLQDNGVLVF